MHNTQYENISKENYLHVSKLHSLWYAEYGNPNGIPIIVLHGGPGAGCDDDVIKIFDLTFWRVILIDQRASKRSKPFADMQENTTQNLISDLEMLRKKLNIEKWLIFGGSWGSTLAIAYGETYPNNVLGFILRGIFLARKHETLNLWFGMQKIFPDAWQTFNDYIPIVEQQDLIQAYYRRVINPDLNIAIPAAISFMTYDYTCSFLKISKKALNKALKDSRLVLGIARTYIHYCVNNFFLKENQLLDEIEKINRLPLIIVHGRYDLITLPQTAFELYKHWPGSELIFVNTAGHSAKEKSIALNLTRATEKIKTRLKI